YCPVGKDKQDGSRQITVASSMPSCGLPKQVRRGAISRNASANRIQSGNASTVGLARALGSLYSRRYKDGDLEWLVLDSTVSRARACAAGAKKKPMGAAARMSRLWAAAEADSAPKSMVESAAWACP